VSSSKREVSCQSKQFWRVRTSDSVVESLFGKMASLIGRIEDLIVEDGKVEGKTETNGMGGGKVGSCNLGGSFVSFQ